MAPQLTQSSPRHTALQGLDVQNHYPRRSVNLLRKNAYENGVEPRELIFADSGPLFGDCGEMATNNAAGISKHACIVAANAVPAQKYARRSIGGGPFEANYLSAKAAPVSQYQSAAPGSQYQSAAPRSQHRSDAPVSQYLLAAAVGSQYQSAAIQPVRDAGNRHYPRSSIGAGHPPGMIQVQDMAGFQKPNVNLDPLLPSVKPPNKGVPVPQLSDVYHRTSVYAASGVPLDMPGMSRDEEWVQRLQFQRP